MARQSARRRKVMKLDDDVPIRTTLSSMLKPMKVQREDPLYKGSQVSRDLRVVIDSELMVEPLGESPSDTLAGLLWAPNISFHRYADQGAPDTAETFKAPWGNPAPIGWVTIELVPEDDWINSHRVRWCNRDELTEAAIARDFYDVACQILREADIGEKTRHPEDALMVLAAQQIRADLVVTNRESILSTEIPLADGVTVVTPEDALGLVGHYLRSTGNFLVWRSQFGKVSVNKGRFFSLAVRECLPAASRFRASCLLIDHQRGDEALCHLAAAVLQRLARSMVQRDEVWKAINQVQDVDTAEDALTGLDSCLLFLMAAVDALARIAHVALELEGEHHLVGWQKRDWLRQVARKKPELAELVSDSSKGYHVLVVLRLLRNGIHGEGLVPLAVSMEPRVCETVVGLPARDAQRIVEAVDAIGNLDAWGLHEIVPGRMHADPSRLIEKLLPEVFSLMNALMKAMKLEGLHHAQISDHMELGLVVSKSNEVAMQKLIAWQLRLS